MICQNETILRKVGKQNNIITHLVVALFITLCNTIGVVKWN